MWGQKGSLLPGFDADMVIIDIGRKVKVGKEHINTRSGWSIMEGHTFNGWPTKTILRGKVTAEWADDSPGMRPVGEPRGSYLPRKLRPKNEVIDSGSPARIAVTDRWEKSDFDRPGFSKETLRYTEVKKT